MLARWRAAGLILPALFTFVTLLVLLALGTWQWQRMTWKEGLISKIEARRTAEPIPYVEALSKFVQSGDVAYTRVRVTGTFDHAQERHLYAPTRQAQGWNVYTLFQPEGGLPPVYVNRGWVLDTLKDPATRQAGQVTGPQTVTGLIRLPETRGYFTPENDIAGNRWYLRDPDAMRWDGKAPPTAEQLALSSIKPSAPFTIDAEAEPANPGGWPKGGTTEIHLPNNHLQYVVTWYGLALTLLGVFAGYARQRLRELDQQQMQR